MRDLLGRNGLQIVPGLRASTGEPFRATVVAVPIPNLGHRSQRLPQPVRPQLLLPGHSATAQALQSRAG